MRPTLPDGLPAESCELRVAGPGSGPHPPACLITWSQPPPSPSPVSPGERSGPFTRAHPGALVPSPPAPPPALPAHPPLLCSCHPSSRAERPGPSHLPVKAPGIPTSHPPPARTPPRTPATESRPRPHPTPLGPFCSSAAAPPPLSLRHPEPQPCVGGPRGPRCTPGPRSLCPPPAAPLPLREQGSALLFFLVAQTGYLSKTLTSSRFYGEFANFLRTHPPPAARGEPLPPSGVLPPPRPPGCGRSRWAAGADAAESRSRPKDTASGARGAGGAAGAARSAAC